MVKTEGTATAANSKWVFWTISTALSMALVVVGALILIIFNTVRSDVNDLEMAINNLDGTITELLVLVPRLALIEQRLDRIEEWQAAHQNLKSHVGHPHPATFTGFRAFIDSEVERALP